MKKIISIMIALMMVISMIPSAFAEGEKVYTFKPDDNRHTDLVSASLDGVFGVERVLDGTPYYLNSTYFSGYGSRGWKILDADETMIKNAASTGNIFRIFYSTGRSYLQSNNGADRKFRVALSLEASETAGFYFPIVAGAANAKVTSAVFDIYAALYENGKNSIDDYNDSTYLIETAWETPSWGEVVHTGKNAIYTKSGDKVVFAVNARDNSKTLKVYSITLNPVLDPIMKTVIKNADDTVSSELLFNIEDAESQTQKVTLSTTVSGTDITDMPVSDNFITYKSSDDNVATVLADGTITAVGKGTATIYAESSDGKYSSLNNGIKVTVTEPQPVGKTYTFNHVDTNLGTNTLLSDVTETTTDKNGNNFFDTYGWKYFPTEGDATANGSISSFYAVVSNVNNSLIFNERYGEFKFALMLKAPEIAAFYKPAVTVWGNEGTANARSIKMYISKPAKEEDGVNYYDGANLVYSGASGSYENTTLTANKAIYAGSNEAIVSAFWSSNSKQRFRYLALDPILDPQLTIAADKTELGTSEIANITSTKVSSTDVEPMDVANGFVEYKSSDVNVATVSADGVVTAVSAGNAKIWAETSDGKVKSNEVIVTVSAPAAPEEDEELKAAFDAKTEAANTYVESTVTGLTDDSTITAKKNSNGTFSLTAPETKNDAKFLYWAKGMSKNKKIVSFSNVLSDYMPEENGKNYLIAVYEDDISETAEYYNANGQRIATGTEPALPSMAGYGKASGWAKFGETNIYVAEYGNKTTPDNVTVTVDGKAQTVPYGTKITCKADESKANFKCWKKSDVNGKTEIVSAEKNYAFNAWESCTVESVYEEHFYTGAKLKIIIDSFTAGEETGVMAEFVGFGNVVEKGIMWNGKKISMTKPGNQFSVIADKAGTYVGYAIIGNAEDGYTLITDGEYVK